MYNNNCNNMNHGDIYFVNLPLQEGSVQSGRRPCILMSNQMALNTSPIVTIIPLTSKNKKNTDGKLEINKFCSRCNKTTAHKEKKA